MVAEVDKREIKNLACLFTELPKHYTQKEANIIFVVHTIWDWLCAEAKWDYLFVCFISLMMTRKAAKMK